MYAPPLASKPECVGRWKVTRGRKQAEEDETRGTVCFPPGCSQSERTLCCSCSLPAAIVVMSTMLIAYIDSLGCYSAFTIKREKQRKFLSPSWLIFSYQAIFHHYLGHFRAHSFCKMSVCCNMTFALLWTVHPLDSFFLRTSCSSKGPV